MSLLGKAPPTAPESTHDVVLAVVPMTSGCRADVRQPMLGRYRVREQASCPVRAMTEGERMVPEVVRQFFQNYRDAFVRFDGVDVAASYHAPSIMARRDAYVLWATPDEVRANSDALLTFYRERGTDRMDYKITSFQAQGPHFALVTVDWTFHSKAADPLSFHATYNLFEQEGAWRILVATVFD